MIFRAKIKFYQIKKYLCKNFLICKDDTAVHLFACTNPAIHRASDIDGFVFAYKLEAADYYNSERCALLFCMAFFG